MSLAAKPALRPFLAADTPMLAAIFTASVQELTGDDYSETQQEAWAAVAEDEESFGKKLSDELTLIATMQNAPVGFAALKGIDHIEMLYVHPSVAGQGVGAMLCDALEKLAGARGAKSRSLATAKRRLSSWLLRATATRKSAKSCSSANRP